MIRPPPRSPLFPYTPLSRSSPRGRRRPAPPPPRGSLRPRSATRSACPEGPAEVGNAEIVGEQDRKSTRLNSSHSQISYAVFCLKKQHRIHSLPIAQYCNPQI